MPDTPTRRSVNNELRLYYLRFLLRILGLVLVYAGWPLIAGGMAALVFPGVFGVVWNGVPVQAAPGKVAAIGLGVGLVAGGAGLLWVRRRMPPGVSPWEVARQAARPVAAHAEPGSVLSRGDS